MTNATPPTPDLSDVDAWRAISTRNLKLQWELLPRAMGKRWSRWDDVWAADPASKAPYLNSATLLRPIAGHEAGAMIARLDQFYAQQTGGPWMLWSAWPTPDLAPFGMRLGGYPPLMVRLPDQPLPETDLRIAEATDEAALRDFDEAMITGYPVSELNFPVDRISDTRALGGPMHFFVGYQDGNPVSCAASYVGQGEVGVYMVATRPEVRGKGFGSAVTAAAIAAAPHLPAVLQASEFGRPVYERLGFQTVSEYTLWYKPRATSL